MSQKGAIHLLLPVIILAVVSLVALSKAQTTTILNDSDVQGVIARNNSDNSGRGFSETRRGSADEIKIKQEVRTSDEKTKAAIKENSAVGDVSRAGTKNSIQRQEDENDDVEEDEATKSAGQEEDDEASGSAGKTEKKGIQELRAISKFPLRIDLSTNQLIMTKNGVERVLTTLPAQAVENMLRAHLKKSLGPKFFQATPSATPVGTPSATPSGEPIASESANITVLESQISLGEDNGQIVYKIPAKKKLRLFGFIPITTDLTGFVSAQTGVLIEERQSLLARILSLLSSQNF